MPKKKYLSIREFAKRIGKSRPTVDYYIKMGTVKIVPYTVEQKGIPVTELKKFLSVEP